MWVRYGLDFCGFIKKINVYKVKKRNKRCNEIRIEKVFIFMKILV